MHRRKVASALLRSRLWWNHPWTWIRHKWKHYAAVDAEVWGHYWVRHNDRLDYALLGNFKLGVDLENDLLWGFIRALYAWSIAAVVVKNADTRALRLACLHLQVPFLFKPWLMLWLDDLRPRKISWLGFFLEQFRLLVWCLLCLVRTHDAFDRLS